MEQVRRIGECKIVKNEYGEFVVKAWDTEGKRFEQADYFACDMVDARATMYAMLSPSSAIPFPFRRTS